MSPSIRSSHSHYPPWTPIQIGIYARRHLVVQLVYPSHTNNLLFKCFICHWFTHTCFVWTLLFCYCYNNNVSFVAREWWKSFFFFWFFVSPQRAALKRKHKQPSVMQCNDVQERARGEEMCKLERAGEWKAIAKWRVEVAA